MCAIFQEKKGKNRAKKGKIFENQGKNILKTGHPCDYCMHETARTCLAAIFTCHIYTSITVIEGDEVLYTMTEKSSKICSLETF